MWSSRFISVTLSCACLRDLVNAEADFDIWYSSNVNNIKCLILHALATFIITIITIGLEGWRSLINNAFKWPPGGTS